MVTLQMYKCLDIYNHYQLVLIVTPRLFYKIESLTHCIDNIVH